jgi:hypothetical protein
MKIYPVGAELLHVNGRADMTELIVVIRSLLTHLMNPCKLNSCSQFGLTA